MTDILKDCAHQGEILLGGLGIRPIHLVNEGDTVGGHTHNFDHVTFVHRGRVRVSWTCAEGCNGEAIMEGSTHMLIPKHWEHSMVALEPDCKVSCVFPEYDANGKRADFMGDNP